MKIWRMLAALCMIGALVFSFAACGAAPTEPSTEATDATDATTDATEETEPLVDPETFKAFIATWYADGSSASYRIVINEDATWSFLSPAGETLLSGTVYVTEDNQAISLYDPEGALAFDITAEEAGTLYVEIYNGTVMEQMTSNFFTSEATNSDAPYTPFEGDETSADISSDETAATEETTDASSFDEDVN